jgi:hypothetical protein
MKKIFTSLAIITILSVFTTLYAQPPGFPIGVDDETPAAPITALLPLGIAIGAFLGYKKLK